MIQLRNVDAKSDLLNGTRLEGRRKNETVFIPEPQNKSPLAFTKLNLGDQRSGRRKKKDSEGDVKLREIASQKIAEILSQ